MENFMGNPKINRITCGIMFNHSFSILDQWGKIVDALLYKKKSRFSPEYFPSISGQYTTNRCLWNKDLGHSLQLTSNNLIYAHGIQGDFEKEYNEFVSRIKESLIPEIVEGYELVTRRIGMVYECEIDTQVLSEFKSRYFKDGAQINDCRFAIRSPAAQGLAFVNVNDFINTIYTLGATEDGKHNLSFDYQVHFLPPQAEIKPKIDSFLKVSKESFFFVFFKENSSGKQ